MSEENIELVRRCYDAFGRAIELQREGRPREWEGLWAELFDENVVLEEIPEVPDSDVYRGLEELNRWFRAGTETFEDVSWEPRDFAAHGPHVVVDLHGSFRGGGSGAQVGLDVTHVFTVRDGKVVHIRGFLDRAQALEAVGITD